MLIRYKYDHRLGRPVIFFKDCNRLTLLGGEIMIALVMFTDPEGPITYKIVYPDGMVGELRVYENEVEKLA